MEQFSKHFVNDREERMLFIAKYIEWGTPILVAQGNTTSTIQEVTTTGIVIIRAKDNRKIITAYPLTMTRAIALFKEAGYPRVPEHIAGRIAKNYRLAKKHGIKF